MEANKLIHDCHILSALESEGFKIYSADEGRLMLAELILKAQAGYYNSHTEELFMHRMDVLKKDRTPNSIGKKFLLAMFYAPSHRRPEAYSAMKIYRV